MDALEMTLLYDYYGDLLTDRQKMCFDLRHNQDLSLAEIAEELQVSRQGVHDNLSRAETLLRNREEKTGCVKRDMACRRVVRTILDAAQQLAMFTLMDQVNPFTLQIGQSCRQSRDPWYIYRSRFAAIRQEIRHFLPKRFAARTAKDQRFRLSAA